MCEMKLPSYILEELPDITESIYYPIKNIQRVKYTCFDVSKQVITFGATSGGIYMFSRSPCDFLQLIPNKDGPITRIAISSDEKYVAYANGKGVITVTRCDNSSNGGQSVFTSKEHQGNEITTMVWNGNNLFAGDDIGHISVLQLPSFIAKTMFHNTSQTIMSLDSRICQLDVRDSMLLVSTLTRCYICDTSQEQYRQIGQKLRDGEFGACFANFEKTVNASQNNVQNFTEAKKFNIVENESIAFGKRLENTAIFCARPSSRLWEATIDGTVKRTHQFKQVLAKNATSVLSLESYNKEEYKVNVISSEGEGQSVNFSKIFHVNSAIFSFRKDALYFLDINNVDNSLWFNSYSDIVDCKIYRENLYLWLSNGSLVSLRFMKIDKYLVKCFIDEKYKLCAVLCALYSDYLFASDLSRKLHILAGLKDKLQNTDLLSQISRVLEKFESLKASEATQLKSGIYVVDNTYNAQTSLNDNDTKIHDKFNAIHPEAIQTLKDLSITVSDKLNSSKKILKEKWDGFEGKMKHFGTDKLTQDNEKDLKSTELSKQRHNGENEQTVSINNDIHEENNLQEKASSQNSQQSTNEDETSLIEGPKIEKFDNDIIYNKTSQKAIEIDNKSIERDKVCKSLYQFSRLSLVGKETEQSNLISIIEDYACDIFQIHDLMLLLEQYCISIGALEESKFIHHNLFLSYLDMSPDKSILIDSILGDEKLYKYFVDSCIAVNMKTQKLSDLGCECGFPLPYNRTIQAPVFPELIDKFIERHWSNQTRDQCYDICRSMPYLWRKIIYLRRNEDLMNLLRILLQMLDENLLHSFLPQFTLDTWDIAIQLYATLHANICLNCNRKFENISVKETLNWDDLGALIIKSVGAKNALKIVEKHATLIKTGDISMKFYHTCLLVSMYEKYDASITAQLTDAIYSSYEYEESRTEIWELLRNSHDGKIKHTALPLNVAARTLHWGLTPPMTPTEQNCEQQPKVMDLANNIIIDNLSTICSCVDCMLCGLPLENEVLIQDGGLWTYKCGHTFHGACLDLNKLKLCPSCSISM